MDSYNEHTPERIQQSRESGIVSSLLFRNDQSQLDQGNVRNGRREMKTLRNRTKAPAMLQWKAWLDK
jgi:hypothetical protein